VTGPLCGVTLLVKAPFALTSHRAALGTAELLGLSPKR
jgi:hypothetical protein